MLSCATGPPALKRRNPRGAAAVNQIGRRYARDELY